MIIYSVTVSIETAIQEDWLGWMRTKHIPEVLATGLFSGYEFRRLLDPEPEPGLATFNIQYTCYDMDRYELYQKYHAARLQAEHTQRYENRFVAFRTILEVF